MYRDEFMGSELNRTENVYLNIGEQTNVPLQKLLEVYQNLPVAFAVFALVYDEAQNWIVDGRYVYVNEYYCQSLNFCPKDFLGVLVSEFFDENEMEVFRRQINQVREWKRPVHVQRYGKYAKHWLDSTLNISPISQYGINVITIIDKSHYEKQTLTRRSTTDDAIIRITQKLQDHDDYETVMQAVLQEIGETIHPTRLDILEKNGDYVSSKFEWCGEGITPRIESMQKMSFAMYFGRWEKFMQNGYLQLDDVEMLKEDPAEHATYQILKSMEIQRFIAVPLMDDKKELIGFLCADNYKDDQAMDTCKVLETVAQFVMYRMVNQKLMKRLDYMSSRDELTGLRNRRSLGGAMCTAEKRIEHYGVFYIDLNFFKDVNDTYGHITGNEVLQETAIRLRELTKYHVYRIGGDEFAILVTDSLELKEYEEMQQNIIAAFHTPLVHRKGEAITVSVSCGYACAPEDADHPDKLRDIADQRMYEMKERIHAEAGRVR